MERNGTIHYLDFGKGKKIIVVLPSLWLTSFAYEWVGKRLEGRYRILIPDLYKGKSRFTKNARSIDDYVAELNTFITSMGIKRFYLISASFSGLIAVNFTQKYPDMVKKMLLVSTTVIPINLQHKHWVLIVGYLKLFYHNMFSIKGLQTNWLWIADGLNNLIRHPRQFVLDALIITGSDYGTHFCNIKKMKVTTELLFAMKDEFIPAYFINQMKKIENLTIRTINDYHTWFFLHRDTYLKYLNMYFS